MHVPSYITGFIDGEGCFSVSFSQRKKMNLGVEVRPSFSVSQNKRNLSVLKSMHTYFKCGSIRYSRNDENYKYETRNVDEIIKHIIPHFERHPLKTTKEKDFEVFKEICMLIKSNHHRNSDGITKIINLAYTMNESGKRKYTKEQLLRFVAR
jgi:hypothetical protein